MPITVGDVDVVATEIKIFMANPVNLNEGLPGIVWTLGQIQLQFPADAPGTYTSVALDHIFDRGAGFYGVRLTTAQLQALTRGQIIVTADIGNQQPYNGTVDITGPIGNGGPLAASGARTWTLSALIAAVQSAGGYERSRSITATLITGFLNSAIAELWDLLVEKWADYYTISTTFPFVAGQDSYVLPTGFYKLRKVELQWDATPTWRRMETHDLAVAHEYVTVSNRRYRYRLQAGYLVFVPPPAQVETIRVYYIPCAPVLVASGDTIDGINGYEELVVQLAWKRCRDREDLDTSAIDREIARLTARIRTAADGRDATEPFYLDERRGLCHDNVPPGWGY